MGQFTDSFYNFIRPAHKVNTHLNDLMIRGQLVIAQQQNLYYPEMPFFRHLIISAFIHDKSKIKNYYTIKDTL